MKNILKPIIIVIAVLFILVMAKNVIAKVAIESGVKAVTGVGLHMDKFNLGILSGRLEIKNIHVANPKGFEEKTMIDIPEVLVDTNIGNILKGKMHVEDISLHLKQFDVIKQADGSLNLDAFKIVSDQKETTKKPKAEKKESKPMDLQIDHLKLRIDNVNFIEHKADGKVSKKEFKINVDEEYSNITNLNGVVSIILVKVLTKTTIGQLTNIDVGALSDIGAKALASGKELAANATAQANEALASGKKLASETEAKAKEALKSVDELGKSTADAAKKSTESVKEAADGVKDLAGGLWGSVKSTVTAE